jgi:hypothetical protein
MLKMVSQGPQAGGVLCIDSSSLKYQKDKQQGIEKKHVEDGRENMDKNLANRCNLRHTEYPPIGIGNLPLVNKSQLS